MEYKIQYRSNDGEKWVDLDWSPTYTISNADWINKFTKHRANELVGYLRRYNHAGHLWKTVAIGG